jgi:DMSO/TMAO reductase YedYZ heme-binding membrane subunit
MAAGTAGLSGQALWYVDRGAGLAALVVLTVAVVLGIVTTLRVHSPRWPRFALADLHRNLALLALVFGAVHVVSSVIDTYVPIGPLDAVVPFASTFKPFWVGVGAVSADVMLAVLITTALRRRIGPRAWRSVHLLAYLSWAAGMAHAIAIGTDSRSAVWGVVIMASCIGAAGGALVQRAAPAGTR